MQLPQNKFQEIKMKAKRIGTASLAGVLAIGILVSSLAADDPTEPRGGKPANGSKPSVEDFDAQVKYQRAFEAVLWSMPAVSKYGFHRASVEIGAGNNVVMASSGPAKPNFELLTANNVTPYVTSTSDLSKGPLVLDVPKATDKAMLFGQVADNWFVTTADIGPIGVDKGKGAKLLITPPDYKGPVPDEYIEVKSPSYIIDFAFRSIQGPKGTPQDAAAMSKSIKIYYLSELPNPKPTRVIDPVDMRWSTLPRYDERWFEDLYQIINLEPAHDRDKVMLGALKTLGIEKGKPFNPDDEMKAIFRRAAIDAYHYMQQKFQTSEPGEFWWKDRKWRDVFFHDSNGGFAWETPELLDYEMRAVRPWFTATYFPNKVAEKPSTMYISALRDKAGNLFEAGKTYKLTVPKDVPVDQFWSLTIYDRETWAFIYTPEGRAGVSSHDRPKMKINEDDSVTLYIGPKAPAGLENNWIPTAGKKPYFMFRFYGPTAEFYDKSFKLADVESVE